MTESDKSEDISELQQVRAQLNHMEELFTRKESDLYIANNLIEDFREQKARDKVKTNRFIGGIIFFCFVAALVSPSHTNIPLIASGGILTAIVIGFKLSL